MSGPKGMGYELAETAEQRARRELVTAQSNLRSALATVSGLIAQLDMLGIRESGPGSTIPATIEGCLAVQREVENFVLETRERIREETATRTRAAIAASLRDAVTAAPSSGSLGLAGGGARASKRTDLRAAPEQSLVEDVQRVLGRLERPSEIIAAQARDVLAAPPGTARLILQRLSSSVDRVNAEVKAERRLEDERAALAARTQLEADLNESDRQYVFAQVVESLEEMGYAVEGTSVTEPSQLVLGSPKLSGYAVAAGISSDAEIVLRPIRTDAVKGGSDQAMEDALCAHLPELQSMLSSRGVDVGRVRSMPSGVVPVPLEAVNVEASRRDSAVTAKRRSSRAREM